MASSILPLDPLMDMTFLNNQTGPLPLKVEAGTEIDKEAGKGFQDSLFVFEGVTSKSAQTKEESPSLSFLLKIHSPESEEESLPRASQEILSSEENGRVSEPSPILNSLVTPPLQKEALAIKEKMTTTPLENAEAILEDDVSMTALSYAMALQEKENHPLQQSQLSPDSRNEAEFPALSSALDADLTEGHNKTPFTQLTQDGEAEISADPKETILPPTAKATPSITQKQAPSQEVKTREPLVANNSAGTGKEAPGAISQSSLSDGHLKDGDSRSSQEEGEEFNSGNTKGGTSSKESKSSNSSHNTASFSETLSKGPSSSGGSSNAQAGLTSLQSGALENIEGKDIEEAFHRGSASIDTKTTAPQSTQSTSSQSVLPSNANLQEQVAFSIKNNAPKGKTEINLQLRPDSLGRLNIKIDINKEGQTFVVVTAERTETRDLLQKDSQQLIELLEHSDLEIRDENMSYSLFSDQEKKDFQERETDPSEVMTGQENENPILENTSAPLISLGMSEIQVPRHGGSWQAIA